MSETIQQDDHSIQQDDPSIEGIILSVFSDASSSSEEEDVLVEDVVILNTPAVACPATSLPTPLPTVKITNIRTIHSVAHDDIANGKNAVLLYIDLELGGPEVGIIKLSQVAYDMKENKPMLTHFNKYIRSHDNAVWKDKGCRTSHGLSASHPSIKDGGNLVDVMKKWVAHTENLTQNKVRDIFAWSGKGCNIEWRWKFTEEIHQGFFVVPKNCQF